MIQINSHNFATTRKSNSRKCVFRACREIKENEYLFQDEHPSVLDKRFRVCLNWYIRKACHYKNISYLTMLANALCPLLSVWMGNTLFGGLGDLWPKYIASLFMIIASISASILTITGAQNKWIRYRNAAEFLKSQRTRYLCEKQFCERNHADIDKKYLNIIEEFMADINKQWMEENFRSNENERTHSDSKGESEAASYPENSVDENQSAPWKKPDL